jgi:hypothetical protein
MLDENAFGLLIAYHSLEEDEYAGERADFIARYAGFVALLRARLTEQPPATPARAVDLGHAVYVELLDDAEHGDLVSWLRGLRSALGEQGYQTAAILSFGAAWIDAAEPRPDSVDCGTLKVTRASLPSEPLRRALLAEAATHGDDEEGVAGWGPGLYLDVDAIEALGRKPKNEPTILRTGGARFYRAGS